MENKKSGSALKNIIIGCLVVLVLCLCCTLTMIIWVSISNRQLINDRTTEGNTVLSDLSDEELEQNGNGFNTKINDVVKRASQRQQTIVLTLTEEEIIGGIKLRTPNASQESLNEISLDFNEEIAIFGVNGNFYLENMPASNVENGFVLDLIKSLHIRVQLSTNETGDEIIVNSFTTGNSLVDKFLPASVKEDIENEINKSIQEANESNNYDVEKITFREGEVEIIYNLD